MLNLPKSREGRTLALFTLLFLATLGVHIAHVLTDDVADGKMAGFVGVLAGQSQTTLVVIATTFIIVEGASMLAERYKRRRYEEGKAVGIAEGKVEGKVEQDKEWREWYERNKDKLEDVGALDPVPEKPA